MSQATGYRNLSILSSLTIETDSGTANPSGTILQILGGTNITTSAAGNIILISTTADPSPLTTKGDLYTYSTQDDRLPVGTDGFLLSANSATPTGLEWITAPSGGVTSVSGTLNRITSSGGATPIIDISASYVGQASITTLGTITTGVWNGTDIALADGGLGASLVASDGGIFYSTAAEGAILAGTATANKVLMSGASAAPTWSTPTFPNASATAGKIIISDGTNWIASTPTYPNTSGTSGKVLVSDGTNNVYSTPTFPNASATSRKIIVSDGTNWVASTETYAVPGTSGNVLTSDGTNWTSATPSGGSVLTATINLTSAQIKALNATPIEFVASPGAGKIIIPLQPTQIRFNYGGSNVFVAGAAQTINLYYGTAKSLGAVVPNATLVGTTSGYYIANASMGSTITAVASCHNLPLNLYNPVATEISGNAANNNTISFSIVYQIGTLT